MSSKKKKVIIGGLTAGLTAVTAISVGLPVSSLTKENQSSSVVTPDKPNTNPDKLIATIPSGTIMYGEKLDGKTITDDSSLNTYLGAGGKFDSSKLSGFSNVDFIYAAGSGNFASRTFSVYVSPSGSATWEDGTKTQKLVTVSFTLTTDDNSNNNNNTTSPSATSPANDTDTFLQSISGSENIVSNAGLNDYFVNLFGSSDLTLQSGFSQMFQNASSYQNVTVSYSPNTANYANKTFNLVVTPKNGYTWSDSKLTSPKIITVTIANFGEASVDVTVPADKSTTYSTKLSNKDGSVWSDYTMDNYFKSYFNPSNLPTNDYQNLTNVKYVSGSADYANKTIKITAQPKYGYVWSDTKNKETKTIVVSANIDTTDYITLPKDQNGNNVWSIKGVARYTLSVNTSDYTTLANIGFADLNKDYNLTFGGWDNTYPYGSVNICEATVYYFWIKVTPGKNAAWADGSTGQKWIQIDLFQSQEYYNTQLLGDFDTNDSLKAGATARDKYGLPNQWVSNFLWNQRDFPYYNIGDNLWADQQKIIPIICDDAQSVYRDYTVEVDTLFPFKWFWTGQGVNKNFNYWYYNLTFRSKETGKNVKTVKGFMFVRAG